MAKKTLILQRFLTFFVLVLFFLLNSCQFSTKNERFECKWSPDYENIADFIDLSGGLETSGLKDASKINIFLNNLNKIKNET